MSVRLQKAVTIPQEQRLIRARCFHPTGTFIEFEKKEIEQSISARFEQQVRKYPQRMALKAEGHQLTYAALNQAANRVAHAILARGGVGEEPIALLFDQGAAVIVAILGVQKAGKFYTPLDPSSPPTRLTSVLEDMQARLIVTDSQQLPLAQALAQPGLDVLDIDAIDAQVSTENPGLSLCADGLACLLYTSGSTGKPKGLLQSHRTVLHRVWIDTNTIHICPDDRLALLYLCASSVSLRVIFGALLNGAALYPFSIREEGLSHLANGLVREGITLYHSIATTFRYLATLLKAEERLPSIRAINLGSESAVRGDVELYRQHFSPDCILRHTFSSGEAGVIRQHLIDHTTSLTDATVSAGYAVEDKEILLVDENGTEVGWDRSGEIVVKSRYLSPGYWRQPELTQTVFRPDPQGSGARIYYTGDLGLMRPNGCLVYLGRKDFQAKIRGHRINVSEIESVLLEHPDIKDAVVVAREHRPGEQELVAYVVPASLAAPAVSALRRFVQERLPDYMLPAAFVLLETLPRTHTGKVDRLALPPLGNTRTSLANPFVAPRTPVEARLSQIWAEVLGLDRVGIQDEFLELGGHSLLAMQIQARVLQTFQVDMPLHLLFEVSTVADMAQLIIRQQMQMLAAADLGQILAEVKAISSDNKEREAFGV